MSILVNRHTRAVCQGITGRVGTLHCQLSLDYGTRIVAGVSPTRGGSEHLGLPVFSTTAEAVAESGANASLIFVPAPRAADAIMEAADAGVELVVCITEGIPVLDMVRIRRALEGRNVKLIGPNCPGVITPGECRLGIMPPVIHRPGRVGIISRSGTLTYEAVDQTTSQGMGQSSCVGIGGDPVGGLDFVDCLRLFESDRDTDGVVLVGEIGGSMEEAAAEYIADRMTKPVVAYIAGVSAPPGKRMGHAGAIVQGAQGTAEGKIRALEEAGVTVVRSPTELGEAMKQRLLGV